MTSPGLARGHLSRRALFQRDTRCDSWSITDRFRPWQSHLPLAM